MKILLAVSIYPPDVGGPAVYTETLNQGLEENNIEVDVCSYQGLKRLPQPLKIWLYFFRLFKKARGCDIIYSFNLTSCGLPSLKAAKLLRKKLFIRVGGDFLWERAVEKGKTRKSLREFYQQPKSFTEKIWLVLMKMVLRQADRIIFTTNFQKEIYQQHFALSREKTVVIPNPFPDIDISGFKFQVSSFRLLYAGRFLKLKNLDTLIDTFAEVVKKTDKPVSLKIIGSGPEKKNLESRIKNLGLENKVFIEKPVSHQTLLKEIQQSYLCLLPSLTEVSPNFALECIALGKPIILTKETGIYENFKEYLIFIDPQNPKDLENKILYLFDEKNYQNYVEKIKKIPISYSWEDTIEKHIVLFKL